MSLLSKLLERINTSLSKLDGTAKTSGELISEVTDGANLVNGKETWELSEDKNNDIECMKQCCNSELATMKKAGTVPSPFYFERVAILSRKLKNYEQEILYCEQYINEVEQFYAKNGTNGYADVRKGPRYKAILKRLPKAKSMLTK